MKNPIKWLAYRLQTRVCRECNGKRRRLTLHPVTCVTMTVSCPECRGSGREWRPWYIRRRRRKREKLIVKMSLETERMASAFMSAGASATEFANALRTTFKTTAKMTRKSRASYINAIKQGRRGAAAGRRLRKNVPRETSSPQGFRDYFIGDAVHRPIDSITPQTPDPSRTDPGPRITECTCGRPFRWLWLVGSKRMWSCHLWDHETGHSRVNESDIDPAYLPETPTRTVNR